VYHSVTLLRDLSFLWWPDGIK